MTIRTIVLKGDPPRFEDLADGTITPGFLIEKTATGVKAHATSGGNAAKMFAIENALQGDEIGDNYTAGDRVQYVHAKSGDEIYAYLADGQDVSVNSPLESNGNGYLKLHTPPVESSERTGTEYYDAIVGYALEALSLGTSGNGATRIKIRVA